MASTSRVEITVRGGGADPYKRIPRGDTCCFGTMKKADGIALAIIACIASFVFLPPDRAFAVSLLIIIVTGFSLSDNGDARPPIVHRYYPDYRPWSFFDLTDRQIHWTPSPIRQALRQAPVYTHPRPPSPEYRYVPPRSRPPQPDRLPVGQSTRHSVFSTAPRPSPFAPLPPSTYSPPMQRYPVGPTSRPSSSAPPPSSMQRYSVGPTSRPSSSASHPPTSQPQVDRLPVGQASQKNDGVERQRVGKK